MKKLLALVLAAVMVFGMMAVTAAADGKTTINLWAFTDEVPGMMTKFLEAHPELADKYEINTTIIATTDGAYQPALDAALANGEVDLYAAESAFVLKYTQGDASEYAASYADLGIDVDADLLLPTSRSTPSTSAPVLLTALWSVWATRLPAACSSIAAPSPRTSGAPTIPKSLLRRSAPAPATGTLSSLPLRK